MSDELADGVVLGNVRTQIHSKDRLVWIARDSSCCYGTGLPCITKALVVDGALPQPSPEPVACLLGRKRRPPILSPATLLLSLPASQLP